MTFQPYAWGAQPGGTYFFHDTIHAIYGVIDVGLS
jgi:hypothetical protein